MLKKIPLDGFLPPSGMLCSFYAERQPKGVSGDGVPEAILAAYSGGADSACLLHFLHKWCADNKVKLFAAHVNHGIRGEEALRDRDFCAAECEKLGIKLFILNADVPKIAEETGKSIESAARDVRYEFFARIMAENNIPVLATAHNADDNLETVLFRLARGTAARGLCGIPSVRALEGGGTVIRPILYLTKKEILDTCRENGIEYVYDSTNSDTVYARNSIRAKAMPALRGINPDAASAALRSCELLRADCDLLDSLAEKYLAQADHELVSKLRLLEKPIFMRALAMIYAGISGNMLEYTHLEALSELVKTGRENSSLSLPGKVRARIEGGRLVFEEDIREKNENNVFSNIYISEGNNAIPGGYFLRMEKDLSTLSSQITQQIQTNEENIYKLFTHICIQSDKINGRLFVRGRLPGDKIRSGGMSKDVRKLFSEKRIPQKKRAGYPIVCDETGILWIPDIALRDGIKSKDENSPHRLILTLLRT